MKVKTTTDNIFLFIANYIQITDLIHTGFLAKLGEENKVIVFLPTLDRINQYPQNSNISYLVWEPRPSNFWGRWKLFRVGLIRVFDGLLSTRIHYQTNFTDWRRRFLRFIASCLPFKLGPSFFTRLETFFLPRSEVFDQLVCQYKPKLVLVGTPGFSDLEAEIIILSRQNNLPTVAINFSWDNLTTNSKHIRPTDFLITWNNLIKKEAVDIHHYSPDSVYVSGPMRFDHYFNHTNDGTEKVDRVTFLSNLGLDSKLPVILITTTSHGVYPHHVSFIESLMRLRDDGIIPEVNLVIRVHPKDNLERYLHLTKERNVYVELAGQARKLIAGSRHKIELERTDLQHLKALFAVSAVALNYSSTITLEALANNCPVINFDLSKEPLRCHYKYEHYRPVINSGAVPIVFTRNELAKHINFYLNDRNANNEAREMLLEKFFFKRDGGAVQRAVDNVREIISIL